MGIFKKMSETRTETICSVIYGQPGSGKTTLALTANNPVLLDFDEGHHRASVAGDPSVLKVKQWKEISAIKDEDLEEFQTIIIDTIGTALTKLGTDLMRREPSLGRNGNLTIQGWGRLGYEFRTFLGRMRSQGKDVILIAHLKETENDGQVTERIVASGSSKDEVYHQADLMGRIIPVKSGKKVSRVLTFSISDAAYAKNVGIDDITLELPSENPNTMAEVIQQAKDNINSKVGKNKELEELQEQIESAKTADDFNDIIPVLKRLDAPKKTKIDWHKRGLAAGLKWVKEERSFQGSAATGT